MIDMYDTWIKDKSGVSLARIRIENNGDQRIYEVNGLYLGSFNCYTNTTHYPNGALFCRGNALTALIDF